MKIGNYKLGTNNPPFIVAEMSGNHNQSLDMALAIVDAVAESGAHALKLQTFTPASMTLDIHSNEFYINDNSSLWKGNSLFSLYQKAHTPLDWHEPIMKRAKHHGLLCFSTPFDEESVDFLETLNVPAYKIASFESIDLPLISKVASTGKPIIISTGMASISEIYEAVCSARSAGCDDLALLKCTSNYPASPVNSNLRTILNMRDLFNCEIGLSDHTLGMGVATAAVAYGATIIEKHFTLSRTSGGIDSSFSLEPNEFKNLVIETRRAWEAIGKIYYGPTEDELSSVKRRRSLYIAEDIKAGDLLTKENLRRIRPGYGLPPKYYDLFLGKRVLKDIKKGTPVTWDLLLNT